MIQNFDIANYVYIDSIISPSYTSAIAQAIQIPGIAGMENNMVIFEFDKETKDELHNIIDNFNLVNSGNFDVCILGSSRKPVFYKNGIHIWIKTIDQENANLMILLSFIILSHPDWRKASMKIFHICKESEVDNVRKHMNELVRSGRLPITHLNIEILPQREEISPKEIINNYSADAGLTIIGFREERLKHSGVKTFEGYDNIGNILFINSNTEKSINN